MNIYIKNMNLSKKIKNYILVLMPVAYVIYLFLMGKMSQVMVHAASGQFGEVFEEIFFNTFIIQVILFCISFYFFTKGGYDSLGNKSNHNRNAGLFLILIVVLTLLSRGMFGYLLFGFVLNLFY